MCVPLSFFYFSWFSLSLGSTNMLIISIGFGWKWWRWWCRLERFLKLLWEVFSAGRCFDTLVLSWARFMWSCSPVMNRKSPWNAKFFILLLLVFFVHIYICMNIYTSMQIDADPISEAKLTSRQLGFSVQALYRSRSKLSTNFPMPPVHISTCIFVLCHNFLIYSYDYPIL